MQLLPSAVSCQNVAMSVAAGTAKPSTTATSTVPGLRERKKARTREALRDAALDLFTRQGFDGTTIEEIADACEVSPRTFFRYFPTKEAVLFADADHRRERLVTVTARRPEDETPLAALAAAMRELAVDYERDREALSARALIVEGSPQLRLYKAEHQHSWEADVVTALERRASASGPARRAELQLITAVATAAFRVSLDLWIADAQAPDLVDLLDGAFTRLANGFEPPAR
jgi:AcrR family transcriptional regulator